MLYDKLKIILSVNKRKRGRTDYWSDTTTDGILREAPLAVRGDAACRDLWRQEVVPEGGHGPKGPVNMTTFLCAGGQGDEEACYVSGNAFALTPIPLCLCHYIFAFAI